MTIGFIIDENTSIDEIEKIKDFYNVLDNVEVLTVDTRKNPDDCFVCKNTSKQKARSFIVNNSTKDYIMFPNVNIFYNVFFDSILEDIEFEPDDLFIFDYNDFCLGNMLFKKEILKKVYFYNRDMLLDSSVEPFIDIVLFFLSLSYCESLRITERYYLYNDKISKNNNMSKEELFKSLKFISSLSDKILNKYFKIKEDEDIEIYKMFYEKIYDYKSENINDKEFILLLNCAFLESFHAFIRDELYNNINYIEGNLDFYKSFDIRIEEGKIYYKENKNAEEKFLVSC